MVRLSASWWPNGCRKRLQQSASRQAHSPQKASPVGGATAADSQDDSDSGATSWRGCTPEPGTRRRRGRGRPQRRSSWQETRTGWAGVCRPQVARVPKRRGHCWTKSAPAAAFFWHGWAWGASAWLCADRAPGRRGFARAARAHTPHGATVGWPQRWPTHAGWPGALGVARLPRRVDAVGQTAPPPLCRSAGRGAPRRERSVTSGPPCSAARREAWPPAAVS